jgi:hypothetical protein
MVARLRGKARCGGLPGSGAVYLELDERNTRDGVTDVANTVTIYKFNSAGKLCNLDVYVAHIGQRPR